MKKILLLNGSPRKNWNTHKLLLEAERGALEMGAETRLVHLFDLKNATDCKSCFACKIKGSKTTSIYRCRDLFYSPTRFDRICGFAVVAYV